MRISAGGKLVALVCTGRLSYPV